MQGIKRRIVYVTLYELIAIAGTSFLLMHLFSEGAGKSTIFSVAISIIAIVWNVVFNSMFEAWERRCKVKGRSKKRRVAHAIMFEGGLTVVTVPLLSWWMNTTLLNAFFTEITILIGFLIYTFVFTSVFDKIFGLPASATGATA